MKIEPLEWMRHPPLQDSWLQPRQHFFASRLTTEQFNSLKDYLEKTLGRPIELRSAKDYSSFIEDTGRGDYDLIFNAPQFARLAQIAAFPAGGDRYFALCRRGCTSLDRPRPDCGAADLSVARAQGWWRVDLSLSLSGNSGDRQMMAVVCDITARKQIEQELAEKMDELLRWQQVMLGRENRLITMKQEVNALLAQLGQPPRYANMQDEGAEK